MGDFSERIVVAVGDATHRGFRSASARRSE
jgi:hypothetical protein